MSTGIDHQPCGPGGPKRLRSRPHLHRHDVEVQAFNQLRLMPATLSHQARLDPVQILNKILADSTVRYSLYKNHHWLMRGPMDAYRSRMA